MANITSVCQTVFLDLSLDMVDITFLDLVFLLMTFSTNLLTYILITKPHKLSLRTGKKIGSIDIKSVFISSEKAESIDPESTG